MARGPGRITKEDVKAAGLRRWNGVSRITTDWVNLFHEPELYYPNGDCLVYLREPGQSSRGPTFRIHTSQLRAKGFQYLLDKCHTSNTTHSTPTCVMANCPGCDDDIPTKELYIPAPYRAGVDATFNHHITTRNFFAWLYNLPLAGRALGISMLSLRDRIDHYRPHQEERNELDLIAYAEAQQYLDFRECVDHALAALYLAEALKLEDLWVDAFAHCVGLSHRDIRSSVEYEPISAKSKSLINKARLEMDVRLDNVSASVASFFEDDLSGDFLGLHQAARDHLDRFRSFLHALYIEQHGFWPPENFDDEAVQRSVYSSMYSDFRNLYHHLVDPKSSTAVAENDITGSGGVCTIQNIQAFDKQNGYEGLPKPLPMLPAVPGDEMPLTNRARYQRRGSWSLIGKKKLDRETKNGLHMQALIDSTNRDWSIMNCVLVRRYSEFEVQTVVDEFESLSMVDGRKVRWIFIYAVLQTLISVMQAPRQVRNTEGLSYSLCCHPPKSMPWESARSASLPRIKTGSTIAPDTSYSHTNINDSRSKSESLTRSPTLKQGERRSTLPHVHVSSSIKKATSLSRSRRPSLRRLVSRKTDSPDPLPLLPRQPFCEIIVQGYGNGLNEVDRDMAALTFASHHKTDNVPSPVIDHRLLDLDHFERLEPEVDRPALESSTTATVSRESSNASSSSAWSRGSGSTSSESDQTTPPDSPIRVISGNSMRFMQDVLQLGSKENLFDNPFHMSKTEQGEHVLDEQNQMRTVHVNTKTWDDFLGR